MDKIDELKKIKELLDTGIITETEFEVLKEKVLFSFNQKPQDLSDNSEREIFESPNIENYKKTIRNQNDNYLKSSAIFLIIISAVFSLNIFFGYLNRYSFPMLEVAFLVFGISIVKNINFRISGIIMLFASIPLFLEFNHEVSNWHLILLQIIPIFILGFSLIFNKSKLFIGISLIVYAVFQLSSLLFDNFNWSNLYSLYFIYLVSLILIGILFIRIKKINPKSFETVNYNDNVVHKNLSISDWIEIFLITIIPLVGIIFLCIWANDNNNKIRKNYAIAYLYCIGIFFLIVFVIFGKIIFNMPGFDFLNKLF